MLVREVMTATVHSCNLNDSVNRAAQLMWEHDFGCVPVTNGAGTVVGMVTDRDITMAAYFRGLKLQEIPVAEVMSTTTYGCEPGTSLEQAIATMRYVKIRRLPVLDPAGKLSGIVTFSDIVRACAAADVRKRPALCEKELAGLVSALSHRPRVASVP
ncbi:MAG: hypothetical protein RL701_4762 [Pseudomonadota bacterium]|jgi:CBS domain-containing protein